MSDAGQEYLILYAMIFILFLVLEYSCNYGEGINELELSEGWAHISVAEQTHCTYMHLYTWRTESPPKLNISN